MFENKSAEAHQFHIYSGKTLLLQRVISFAAIAIISFGGLEALVYVNNLYQQSIYLQLSGLIFLFLLIWLYFIFDLHFKKKLLTPAGFWQALRARFHYFYSFKHLRHFQNYLILPGIIYWSAVVIIAINFQHYKLQQYIALTAAAALVLAFTMFKEIFYSKQTPIHSKHFLVLSYIKIYAAWLVYSGSLGIVWFYCFPEYWFSGLVFLMTFMLLYQALFQFSELVARNVLVIAVVSLVLGAAAQLVYIFWNVNYFTAGVFLAAILNFLWGLLYHLNNKSLNRIVFIQQALIFILAIVMVFGITNFSAKIDRCG